jgi:hypothetical protein
MAKNITPDTIVDALVISDIIFNKEHTSAGTIIRLDYGTARHLEAGNSVVLGERKDLEAQAQKFKTPAKAA